MYNFMHGSQTGAFIGRYCHLLSISLLISITACQTSREITTPTFAPKNEIQINPSLLALYGKIATLNAGLRTLQGFGAMQIQSPELNQSLTCAVRIEKGKGMQLTGSIFLGITAFDALIKEDSVFLYSPLQRRLYIGENNQQNLKKITGLNATLNDILDAFMGVPKLDSSRFRLEKASFGDGKIAFYLSSLEGVREIFEVNELTENVESIRLIDSTDRTKGAIFFRNYERVYSKGFSISLPKEIEFVTYEYSTLGQTNDSLSLNENNFTARQILIRYNNREINTNDFKFTFDPSKNAKVYGIEQMQFNLK